MSDHFRKLKRMYLSAPINELYSPSLQVSEGAAVVTFEVRPQHFHAAEALAGGIDRHCLDDLAADSPAGEPLE